jgi:hypothetical protein
MSAMSWSRSRRWVRQAKPDGFARKIPLAPQSGRAAREWLGHGAGCCRKWHETDHNAKGTTRLPGAKRWRGLARRAARTRRGSIGVTLLGARSTDDADVARRTSPSIETTFLWARRAGESTNKERQPRHYQKSPHGWDLIASLTRPMCAPSSGPENTDVSLDE